MVYVSADGNIKQGPRPWSLGRVIETFWSFLDGVGLFFQTLIPISLSSNNGAIGYRSNNNNNDNNAIGYGSGRSSQSGRRNGGNRPLGRFRTMSDIAPPPMFGGCAGGACGR